MKTFRVELIDKATKALVVKFIQAGNLLEASKIAREDENLSFLQAWLIPSSHRRSNP
jgi:hypothetical protein